MKSWQFAQLHRKSDGRNLISISDTDTACSVSADIKKNGWETVIHITIYLKTVMFLPEIWSAIFIQLNHKHNTATFIDNTRSCFSHFLLFFSTRKTNLPLIHKVVKMWREIINHKFTTIPNPINYLYFTIERIHTHSNKEISP